MSLAVEVSPSLLHLPPDVVSSSGLEAIEFARDACGIELDPWQSWFVDQALSERIDASGEVTWAAFEVALVAPRQNGKNYILETIQLASMYLFGDMTLVHSAHKFDTSVEHFNRLRWLFENTPELSTLLLPGDRSFVTSNGKEHIRLNTGQRVLFKARYRGSSRGFVGDKVFLDEAYDLHPSAMGATIPTLSTRPGAQVYYTSSAPHASSRVLHAVRARAVTPDVRDRLLFVEYGNDSSVLELEVSDPAFMDAIRSANPAVAAGRITEDYIVQEIRTFSGDPELVEEHQRERLGVPTMPLSADDTVILPNWPDLALDGSTIAESQQWALAVAPDRGWASLGKAGRTSEGKLHVEWMDHRVGTGWIVERVLYYWGLKPIPIRIHKSGPEAAFIAPLRERGVEVVEVSTADVAQATGQLLDAAANGQLVHLGQPSLDKAVRGAVLSMSSDGASVLSQRKSSVEITPLLAVTVALGGVPETPTRPVFAA